MYESSDLRKGLKIEYEGDPYIVVQFDFVKPGKGQALYKCRLRNMLTGIQFDRNFRSGEKFGEPNLEEKQMEYLYKDGDKFSFGIYGTGAAEIIAAVGAHQQIFLDGHPRE